MKEFGKSVAEKYIEILANKKYSTKTINSYVKHVKDFVLIVDENPYKLNKTDLKQYLLSYKYNSTSQQNQVISSLKLYYKYILNIKNFQILGLERPRKEKHLPRIIDKDYLLECIGKIENLKQLLALGILLD